VRAPALRFALFGAVLFFALDRWLPAARSLPPTGGTDAASAEDALLLNVALDAGLDRSDPWVRYRLANLGRYLGLAPETADDAVAEREARTLGLVHSDPIIRRHLIDLMHLTAASLPPAALPDDAELRRYYADHADAYALPDRVRLTHVYLSRDRRGANLAADAAALAARLHGQGMSAGAGLGDGFARGARVGPASTADLTRVFGADFATTVAALPVGQWSPPIASSYGLHLVWVEERLAAAPPPFEEVRGQLLHAWLRERRTDQLAASPSSLRGG